MKRTPLQNVLTVTKALADQQRVRMLLLLQSGELCVCQIVGVLKLATSTVSKHLSILAAAGLVDVRKEGRWAYYRLAPTTDDAEIVLLAWLEQTLRRDESIRADRAALSAVKRQDLEVLCRQQRPN